MVWSGTVSAMSGTVEWEHRADGDGGGCGELVMDVLGEAVGAWWVCAIEGVVGAKFDGEGGG